MERLLLDLITYLTASAADDDTTIQVFDTTEPEPSFRVRVDDEVMRVTAVDAGEWTVTRGVDGTTPAPHTEGQTLAQVITPDGLSALIQQAIAAQFAYNIQAYRQGGSPPEVTTGSEETIIFPSKSGDPLDWYDEETGIFAPQTPGWWLISVELTLLDNSAEKTGYLSLTYAPTTAPLSTTAVRAPADAHLYMQNVDTFYANGDDDSFKVTCYLDSAYSCYVYPQAKATHLTLRYLGPTPTP